MLRRVARGLPLLGRISKGQGANSLHKNTLRFLISSAALGVSINNRDEKLEVPDSSTLTSAYLIKNSASQTVDSATTLITQTVAALEEINMLYAESLRRLLQALELNLQVLGNEFKEDLVWDAMLEIRKDIYEEKEKKDTLETIFNCAEKTIMAAAEAAHAAGADYAGVAASERLYSAQCRLETSRRTVADLEQDVRQMEMRTIGETTRHAEKRKASDREPAEGALPASQSGESTEGEPPLSQSGEPAEGALPASQSEEPAS